MKKKLFRERRKALKEATVKEVVEVKEEKPKKKKKSDK
jgi:hypothetical protein